jgi:hypothetical protein
VVAGLYQADHINLIKSERLVHNKTWEKPRRVYHKPPYVTVHPIRRTGKNAPLLKCSTSVIERLCGRLFCIVRPIEKPVELILCKLQPAGATKDLFLMFKKETPGHLLRNGGHQ